MRCSTNGERRTLRGPSGYDELVEYLRGACGFVVASWCGSAECERRVKDDSAATIRCLPLAGEANPGTRCISCGKAAAVEVVWAQAY